MNAPATTAQELLFRAAMDFFLDWWRRAGVPESDRTRLQRERREQDEGDDR